MRTKEMLERLPQKNRAYLDNIKETIKKADDIGMKKELKATARGYIKGLVDCGVIDDFKPLWCWFTL